MSQTTDMDRLTKKKPYYEEEQIQLYLGDTFKLLNRFEEKSVDMIFADPPYFLSNGGISCSSGKQVSVNKGEWDMDYTFSEKYNFTRKWIKQCYRVLKDDGTIWISGTLHNIYMVGFVLEKEGYKIINNITWEKTNPPPNLA